MSVIESTIVELGFHLPEPFRGKPFALTTRSGSLLFTSGAGSTTKGKLGADLSIQQGYAAAREAGLQLLANTKADIGDLDRIVRIVSARCLVNSDPLFIEQPAVANGFTEFMLQVFGDSAGAHTRTTMGVASLPEGIAVEIDMIVEVAT